MLWHTANRVMCVYLVAHKAPRTPPPIPQPHLLQLQHILRRSGCHFLYSNTRVKGQIREEGKINRMQMYTNRTCLEIASLTRFVYFYSRLPSFRLIIFAIHRLEGYALFVLIEYLFKCQKQVSSIL